MSNILYMSCHAILEYDELRLFDDLAREGHDLHVFSLGSYVNPRRPVDEKRPAIDSVYDDEVVSLMLQGLHERLELHMLARFDACIVMHKPEWVTQNWETFKAWGKPVIWRSIGQSVASVEAMLRCPRQEGLRIVRYSPREAHIPGYVGSDALIRFAKDPDEWKGWTGDANHVALIGQRIRGRGLWCNADLLDTITSGMPRKVYGPDNRDWGNDWAGLLDYEQFKVAMRRARCLVYGGTVPASYTLVFVEALMTGLPVVSLGPGRANRIPELQGHQTFEVQDIIEHGVSGYCSDDVMGLRRNVAELLKDHKLARRIGKAGRARAIELFDAGKIRRQWLALFQSLGLV